ncbi:TIGR00153 family protein [Haliovirga abyssi]|uniref:TIGR00153 family protein n=1 Tax=Haliovirga abyssi TaxID=2996794 RepID=A0AAU9DBZ1_9FUSO|nr:TIGR00153 family protein [Haliovirga abyssi]BDU50815.1 TIGR00153 family protein [Haliovirga abyssi]
MIKFQSIFAKSPFTGMVEHIEKVELCLDELEKLLKLVGEGKSDQISEVSEKIYKYEHEADVVKDELRVTLSKNLLLPIDKGEILSILTAQDGIADVSEDIAKLFSLRKMEIPKELVEDYKKLTEAILKAAKDGIKTIKEINNLFEVGFKGPEVERVVKILKHLERKESLADDVGLDFTRKLLALEGKESPVAIYMWMRIIKVMGDLANISEKLSNRFRLILN